MGADAFHICYGLRWEVDADNEEELSRLEARADPRQVAARTHGLGSWWGISSDEHIYFLMVGELVGHFGWQHRPVGRLEGTAIARIMDDTAEKLRKAGLDGAPAWHFQFEPKR